MKCLLKTNAMLIPQSDFSHLPITQCSFELGKLFPHWSVTRGLPSLMWRNNFCIQLPVGYDGLEPADSEPDAFLVQTTSVCKLCLLEPEDQAQFIARCPRLKTLHSQLLLTAPPPLQSQRHYQYQHIRIILGQSSCASDICH